MRLTRTVSNMLLVFCCLAALGFGSTLRAAETIKALIVDGQNNHAWAATTPVLRKILEDSGRFTVEVATTPPKKQPMAGFRPTFADYGVVVLNYNGDEWPKQTKEDFVAYVRGGGGVVVYHAADNAFPNWPEYNEIIGLGGWGGRNEKDGPMVRYRDGEVVLDTTPGRAGRHPKRQEFRVVARDREHPIVRGLPEVWMHTADELYGMLRGPARNLTVLATGYSDPKQRNGTGENEPVLFTIRYGEGRVFHDVLGHGPEQMESVGFIVTLLRGTEWAATGQVSLTGVPADFPTADKSSRRSLGVKPPAQSAGTREIRNPYAALETYEAGSDRKALVMIEQEVRAATSPEQRRAVERKLLGVLRSAEAYLGGKDFACRMLRRVGGEAAVPVLAGLLGDAKLSHLSRFALQGLTTPRAGQALLEALPKAAPDLQVGIIESLGERGDQPAISAIAGFLRSDSASLRRAALVALGKINGAAAVTALTGADVAEALTPVLHAALLRCADGLRSEDEAAALGLYRSLLEEGDSIPTRIAAARGIIAVDKGKAVPLVCSMFRSPERALREAAGRLVLSIPGPAATAALAEQFPALDADAQMLILDALAVRGDSTVAPVVSRAAAAENADVRLAALRALATVGGAEHVSLLLEAAAGEGESAVTARESVSRLVAPGVNAALRDVVAGDAPSGHKTEALAALRGRADAEAVPTMLQAARDGADSVREEALCGLVELAGPKQTPVLVSLLVRTSDTTEQGLIQGALAGIARRADAVEPVVADIATALDAADTQAAGVLLAALSRVGGERALSIVGSRLRSQDAELKRAAVRALSEWQDSGPRDDLLSVVRDGEDLVCRVLAFRGYVRLTQLPGGLDPEQQVADLAEAMTVAPRPDEKKLVLAALGGIASRKALELAQTCTGQPALAAEAKAAAARIKRALEGVVLLEDEAVLVAKEAAIRGKGAKYESAKNRDCIGVWKDVGTSVSWSVEVLVPGDFELETTQSMRGHAGATYTVELGDATVEGTVVDTGDWGKFVTQSLGQLKVAAPGVYTLSFNPKAKPKTYVTNLRSITLRRTDESQ